jgi:apolipoprotein D and lipocalin family protein
LNVVNKGYNSDRVMWQKTEGVAYFAGKTTRAALKVSFLGPVYGGYNLNNSSCRKAAREGIPMSLLR